ncbi:MAG: 2-phospho-L-lactate guanylyltransferase [Afipia sp.]|mgnify:CR=1 FL=1|nr:2-phospho-L-lactate guanylyltransferase [Afipia sp.]OJW64460.1 MAG: 2-phospho-L-lactate guanylyltransferase [Afipia sp. 64-13]
MTLPRDSEDQVWAVVPAKRFSRAKMRLASVLTRAERAQLAQAMLHDVMSVLSAVDELAGIVVVSGDPSVARVARPFGARLVTDIAETGVNDAVREGLHAVARDSDAGAMVVPGDVPFATVADVQSVLRVMVGQPMVLVPALRDGGTNCLAMTDPFAIAPCFGDGSFHAHRAAARRAGIAPAVCHLEGLGHDVDRPDDLVSAPRRFGSRTSALLDELNINARLGQPVLQSQGGAI